MRTARRIHRTMEPERLAQAATAHHRIRPTAVEQPGIPPESCGFLIGTVKECSPPGSSAVAQELVLAQGLELGPEPAPGRSALVVEVVGVVEEELAAALKPFLMRLSLRSIRIHTLVALLWGWSLDWRLLLVGLLWHRSWWGWRWRSLLLVDLCKQIEVNNGKMPNGCTMA